jgi:ABC-type nitrate/sulfonate/bicarbonate transport system permease component
MVRSSLDRSSLYRGLRSRNRGGSRRLPDFRPMTRALSQSWGILLLLAAWQAWVTATGFNSIVMPSPRMVFDDLAGNPMAYLAPALATLLVAFVGAACGFAVGVAMALASWMSRVLGGLILPLGLIFSSIPVVCLIPILARVLGYGEQNVGAIVAVLTFFPAFVYTSGGLRATPPMTSELFSVYGARRLTVLLRLCLPAAAPNMMIAVRIGAAQSIIAAMIGEVPDGRHRARSPVCGHAPEFADGSRGRRRPGGRGDFRLVLRTDRHRRGAGARPLELSSKRARTQALIVFLEEAHMLVTRRSVLGRLGGLAMAPALMSPIGRPAFAADLQKVSVQFGWLANVEYAGIFLGLEKGYFKAEGIDLAYSAGGPNAPDALVVVAAGKADFGFASWLPLLDAIDKGNDFVIVGTELQQSPLGVLSLAKNPIRTPKDIVGKKILAQGPNEKTAIDAVLGLAGLPKEWTMVTTGFSPEPLLAGDGDGYTAFGTNQPITLEKMGLKRDKDYYFTSFDQLASSATTTSSSAPALISRSAGHRWWTSCAASSRG